MNGKNSERGTSDARSASARLPPAVSVLLSGFEPHSSPILAATTFFTWMLDVGCWMLDVPSEVRVSPGGGPAIRRSHFTVLPETTSSLEIPRLSPQQRSSLGCWMLDVGAKRSFAYAELRSADVWMFLAKRACHLEEGQQSDALISLFSQRQPRASKFPNSRSSLPLASRITHHVSRITFHSSLQRVLRLDPQQNISVKLGGPDRQHPASGRTDPFPDDLQAFRREPGQL